MKLLLTSAGFTNQTIIDALQGLLSKPISESKMVYVPTAADVEPGHKDWLMEELNKTFALGFAEFDIVNINAIPLDLIAKRFKNADVIVFSGGDDYHLISSITNTKTDQLLKGLLKEKVYVGVSAGSFVTSSTLYYDTYAELYGVNSASVKVMPGLGYVDFVIYPHYQSDYFTKVTKKNVESIAKKSDVPIYLLDDQSAVVVDGDSVSVVSEGEWELLNQN